MSGRMAQSMHEGPVSSSQFPDLTATPAYVSAAWKSFVLRVVDAPQQLTATYVDNLIGMVISAPRDHRVRAEIDGRVCEGYGHSGSVSFVPAGVKTQVEGTRCPRLAALFVPDAFLHRVITEHWEADPKKVEMFWQFQVRDPVIEAVITSLRFEAENQAPSGQLYAESACEFLAHHVIRSYSSLSPPVPRLNGGLPGKRLKLVHEYIEDNLGEPIALRELAALAGVSTRHFGRAFRQALGVPPHAYVLARRLATARELLINQPLLTIGEIASKTGFSSSSHLASAFRRHFGFSPIAFRKQR
jgi:AraC family transcriptional regulator